MQSDKKADRQYSDQDLTELEWAEKIRNGDEYAFRDLFKTYYQAMVNLARRYVRDMQIAENVVGDVFLKVWTNRKGLHVSTSMKAYLFQAVRNGSLNYIKRSENERRKILDIRESLASARTPEDDLSEKEMLEAIRQAIAELPERSRSVFTMHRYDRLKYAEIAEILNISVGTVETHMVRALKFLRKRLSHFLALSILL